MQLQQELQVQQNEISREMRLKEKLDKEVKQLHIDMEAKMGDIKALNLQGQRAKEEQQRLEQQLKELKVSNGVWTHTLYDVLCRRQTAVLFIILVDNIDDSWVNIYLLLYVFFYRTSKGLFIHMYNTCIQ